MNEPGTVNSQIIDSTTGIVTLITGQAPSQAFGLLDAVMVETLGMAMHNAVSRQQGASVIGSAAVTAACAKMLAVPFPIARPVVPPSPPVVEPIDGPPAPHSPSGVVAQAYADAGGAIAVLNAQAAAANNLAQSAQSDLGQLIVEAGGTAPPPPPSPTDNINAAYIDATTAITTLKTQASETTGVAQAAQNDLDKLVTEAGGTPPATPHP